MNEYLTSPYSSQGSLMVQEIKAYWKTFDFQKFWKTINLIIFENSQNNICPIPESVLNAK